MKRAALIIGICLAFAVSGLASPTIEVDSPEYDFGSVLEGFAVEHTFVIQNVGDQTLEIESVHVSCGCTATTLATKTLAPNESVDLKVLVDTAGFSGLISKLVTIRSNDPDTPSYVLRITGTVNRAEAYHISVGDMNYLFYLLIDVRTTDEYAAGHLMGAINIPFDELEDWYDRLPTGVLTIVYDQTGEYGDEAALLLNAAGFAEARSMLGGLNEWQRQYQDKFILTSAE